MRHARLLIALAILSLGGAADGAHAAGSHPHLHANAGASSPVLAARTVLGLVSPNPCSSSQPGQGYSAAHGCPVTIRLQNRLRTARARQMDPVCRCQAVPVKLKFQQMSGAGGSKFVTVYWYTWGVARPQPLDLHVLHASDGWRVDDIFCPGQPGTSIYKDPIRPCT